MDKGGSELGALGRVVEAMTPGDLTTSGQSGLGLSDGHSSVTSTASGAEKNELVWSGVSHCQQSAVEELQLQHVQAL